MRIEFHPHALERMAERGATAAEVIAAIERGERIPARSGRWGFRRNFARDAVWRGKLYHGKQIEVIASPWEGGWLVITVVVRFF